MQDYKYIVTVMIRATVVNTQTHRQLVTGYIISSASQMRYKKSAQFLHETYKGPILGDFRVSTTTTMTRSLLPYYSVTILCNIFYTFNTRIILGRKCYNSDHRLTKLFRQIYRL